ncbi:glycogen synthase GlgA [Vibrio sp. SCSIO 43136]|uniref:glycogen synthase GlgA n=1 Tax=Vibrio sp. SCSIO 43136 TaxID=2819101 RepID=UPI0020763FBF|nr:glycogen synthase GlgA [Vibrio sp. SCSIO 43136]USD66262.1 glycogen synthase GlgA [Vibrio sp. SCSIO 43136]
MDSKLNIWFTVSEAEGLVKSGGLADVAKALPKALQNLGHDVAIVIPAYQKLPGKSEAEIVLHTELDYWPHIQYSVRKLALDGVTVFAVECDKYFDRPELYAEANEAYPDNGERFGFFASAALDMIPKLGVRPDIVHANDWHTGLVPFLLKTRYEHDSRYQPIKSVLTVHNAIFKGIYSYHDLEIIPELNLSGMEHLRYGENCISMLRAGVNHADKVNAVSPNYASELMTALGSHGMVDDFVHRSADLYGILNGCDYSEWNPQTDKHIDTHFGIENMLEGKAANKSALQGEVGLPKQSLPMYGMVCRLTHQKGFHYLLPILRQFLLNDVQLVIVGTGEPEVAKNLHQIASEFPDKFAFVEAYNNRLAHLVEAGSDFFLMPSEFEACGLNQIYSMAYGTLPIVRAVGGLKDTVTDFDQDRANATGFCFDDPEPYALLAVMQRSLIVYLQHPEQIQSIQRNAMERDFSWEDSAKEYLAMYHSAMVSHRH